MRERDTRPLTRVGGMPRVVSKGALGAFGEVRRDHDAALRRWQRDYGGVFLLEFGPTSFVVAADAAAASEMFIDRAHEITRAGLVYEPLKALFGQSSMLVSEGPEWRERRRTAQPYFRQRALAALADRVHSTLHHCLGEIEPGPNELYQFSGSVALSVSLATVFGQDLPHSEYPRLFEAINYAIRAIAIGWVSSRLPRWLPIPGRRHLRRETAYIHEVLEGLAQARLAKADHGDDLLGMLLYMVDNGTLSREELSWEAITLLIAGYETTGNAMAWALYEIAKDPELAAGIRAEADELDDAPLTTPKRLPFTTKVFKEAMRMYPSGLWLPRTATEDTTLGGYPIPEGTSVVCSPYLVHHDPHAWTDPERFDPERFAEDSDEPRHRFAYMPFGLGQHMCVGQHLAMLEATSLLAHFVRDWDLAAIPEREPKIEVSTTMSTRDGIWIDCQRRAG